MATTPGFKDLIEAAAKPYQKLWKDDGTLNLNELSRFYEAKRHPISAASFSRIFRNNQKQRPGEAVIEATHAVFNISLNLLRGEPMSLEMEGLLGKASISAILLAERIEKLPKDEYFVITEAIARAEENVRKLREAMKNSNVTQIDRNRRP